MTRITITSKDAERMARSFNDLIGPKGLDRIRRKAVNTVGSSLRKQTRIIGPAVIGTSAAALSVQGKAASPGSDNPRYVLRMARKIPVARLKAKHRKIKRRSGRASLTLTLPGGDKIVFRSIHRDGASFRLLRAGPLPERGLGRHLHQRRAGIHEGRLSRAVPAAPEAPEKTSCKLSRKPSKTTCRRDAGVDPNCRDRRGAGAAAVRNLCFSRRHRHVGAPRMGRRIRPTAANRRAGDSGGVSWWRAVRRY